MAFVGLLLFIGLFVGALSLTDRSLPQRLKVPLGIAMVAGLGTPFLTAWLLVSTGPLFHFCAGIGAFLLLFVVVGGGPLLDAIAESVAAVRLEQAIHQLEQALRAEQPPPIPPPSFGTRQPGLSPPEAAARAAAQIGPEAGPYALALKALAEQHFEAATTFLDQAAAEPEANADKLTILRGRIHLYQGRYAEAAALLHGVAHANASDADLLTEAGVALLCAGDTARAEPLLQQALELRQTTHGPCDPAVARSTCNLAVVAARHGHMADAQTLGLHAADMLYRIPNVRASDVAITHEHLATFFAADNKLHEAKRAYRTALSTWQRAVGAKHERLLSCLKPLALIYLSEGKYPQAEGFLHGALEIDEQTQGPSHLDVATDRYHLGLIHQRRGQYANAETHYERALAIREARLASDHPDVTRVRRNLLAVYSAREQYTKAAALGEQLLADQAHSLGENHPDLAPDLTRLARLYLSAFEYDSAEPCYQRLLSIQASAECADAPAMACTLEEYASLLRCTNREPAAQKLEWRAKAIRLGHNANADPSRPAGPGDRAEVTVPTPLLRLDTMPAVVATA